MAETFPTVQWVSEGSEEALQRAGTKSLFSPDIVRWRERTREPALGLFLESAGTEIINSTDQKTIYAPSTKVCIPRVKKASPPPKGNYILLKKYDGFVSSRSQQSFIARLYETLGDYPVMEAEFDLEELSEADRELVVEGAALVWTIGYHDDGPRTRESLIYMRRRPGWDKKEIEQAKQALEELTRDIQWK